MSTDTLGSSPDTMTRRVTVAMIGFWILSIVSLLEKHLSFLKLESYIIHFDTL